MKTASRCTAYSSFLLRISAFLQKNALSCSSLVCLLAGFMGGRSPERSWVKQSHPNGPQRGAKAWEINTEGQFRLEGGTHSPPQMWCASSRQGGTTHLWRGATGTSFLHPPLHFIAFSCNIHKTCPGATWQGSQPLLEAPHAAFSKLQRKSVMSSGRFSQLPTPP